MNYVTDTVIEGNLITHNYKGIILWDSDNNTLYNNSIQDNVDEGMLLWNLCDNNTVLGNRFVDNGNYGVYVDRSSGNVFRLNSVSESHFGLYLYYPTTQYNRITENTFFDNHNGLFILRATNNSIYLNNFLNNTHSYNLTESTKVSNTWDSGYPTGGNYWDDYTGTDINADGIGDIPYTIIGDNNPDRYPLMNYPLRYGVKLDCVNKEKNVHPKGNITYEILVTNTGNIVDNITLSLPLPCKCGWMESLNSYSVELLPNHNKTVLLNVSTIWDLPISIWYWTTQMTATSIGNPTKFAALTFNTTIVNYTTISIVPLSRTITGMKSFTINITVDPNKPIAGVQVNLSFDPNLLICTDVRMGDLFQGNTLYFINGTIDNFNGCITGIAVTTINRNTSLDGTFVVIHFTTRNHSGTSILNLTDVAVGTPEGNPLSLKIQNGSVTVVWTPGDINNDGYTNIFDLILISQHWGETGQPGWESWDINSDGIINILDAILIGQHWTG
jgi:parallel beta-helix repeat protein